MAATWVAVSTSTTRRAAGWASYATSRLLEEHRRSLGKELQHRGGPLAWQLSSLSVHHMSCYSHKVRTQHPCMPFELWLKSQHVFIPSVHDKKDGAQHQYDGLKRMMGLCTQHEP